jgi:amino acid transporter
MFSSLVKTNYKNALIVTIFFLLIVSFFNGTSEIKLLSSKFFLTFIMYFLMIVLALDAIRQNKIIGMVLFSSLFFLPPSIFSDYKGELFPITYLIFITYLLYVSGLVMFKNWKKNTGL